MKAPPTARPNRAPKLHVVWDNTGAHRRPENATRELGGGWAVFHRLPPYTLGFNPAEHVWCTSKWGPLANAPPGDLDALNAGVHADLDRQAREQSLLKGHFRCPRLPL